MLTRVPEAMRVANRAMVLRHPNAMDCQVLRKAVQRTAGASGPAIGGLPTLGGMAVLSNDDEAEVDYQPVGDGKLLFTGVFQAIKTQDRGDAPEATPVGEAMIEPLAEGAFQVKDGDLVLAMPGGGVVVPYECTKVLTYLNIPPYVQKVELAAQGDALFDSDIEAIQDAKP